MADRQVRKAGPVPTEVLDYWDGKGLRPAFSYLDVWNEEHDWGFTAAKVMRTDVLGELRRQLAEAFALGKDFGQFKSDLEPAMRALGWWDKHQVKDPITGELADVDPPRRMRTIFDTNMRTARAVGQLERAERNKDTRPYLLYTVGPSHRHREQHLAWHGTMLPIDDPFWQYAFPPNGWGCFTTGTPVLTPGGWRPIESISDGDLVISGSGDARQVRQTHARPYKGEVFRLSGEWGHVLATPNHRFLTHRGWVRADGLKLGDVLVQLPEHPALDPVVGQVHQPYAAPRDFGVSLPAERHPVAEAFDTEHQLGHKHIDPVGLNVVVVHGAHAHGRQPVENALLVGSGLGLGVRVRAWVGAVRGHATGGALRHHLLSPERGGRLEALGHRPNALAVGLRLAEPLMRVARQVGELVSASALPLLGAPLLVAGPLPAYSLAGAASTHAVSRHQTHHRSVADRPAGAQLRHGEPIGAVQDPEGFVSGAPIDRFDSLDDFVAWSRSHCHLREVSGIGLEMYNGLVHNLTVPGESYVVPAGITHNCKCNVQTVSESMAKRLERDGILAPQPDPVLDDEGRPTGHVVDQRVPISRVSPTLVFKPFENPRTGKVELVPDGIDPGFHHKPGEGRAIALGR